MAQDKAYSLKYHRLTFDDLARLDSFWQDEVQAAIENKSLTAPEIFGKPLRQSLKGCRSLRVGDYRVVFRIDGKTINVLAITHRSSKYKGVEKRI